METAELFPSGCALALPGIEQRQLKANDVQIRVYGQGLPETLAGLLPERPLRRRQAEIEQRFGVVRILLQDGEPLLFGLLIGRLTNVGDAQVVAGG